MEAAARLRAGQFDHADVPVRGCSVRRLGRFAAGSANYSNLLVGWTAGGGMEWMFHPNWSVKAEYLYYDLGAVSTSGPVAGTSPSGAPFAAFTLASQASARFNGHIVRGA